MKFGKQFDFHKIPEWSEYYLDYRLLKKILKQNIEKLKEIYANRALLLKQCNKSAIYKKKKKEYFSDEYKVMNNEKHTGYLSAILDQDRSILTSDQTEEEECFYSFQEKFIELVNIVNTFFKSKYNDNKTEFECLKHNFAQKKNEFLEQNHFDDSSINPNKSIKFKKSVSLNIERDELGYAVSWKRAFSHIYNNTSWLHGYCLINLIACQKILKKFRKHFSKFNSEYVKQIYIEMSEYLIKLPFSQNSKEISINSLRKEIKCVYSEYFTNGNKSDAKKSLQSRMKPFRQSHLFNIAFNLGMLTMQVIFFVLIFILNYDNKNISPLFPCFSFSLMIILCFLGLSLMVSVFRKFRINYIYIYEVDPKFRLTQIEILKMSLNIFNLWFFIFNLWYVSLQYSFLEYRYIFPFSSIVLFLLFLVWPFHCFYFSLRLALFKSLRNCFYPIGAHAVKFRDFMFGDMLTSLTPTLNTFTLMICLMSCSECLQNDERRECKRHDVPGLIANILPFAIRFFQCLNRYYYTKMAWPNLANAAKYSGGIIFTVLNWYCSTTHRNWVILVGIINCSYFYYWDIILDWDLGYFKTKHFFLREKLLYPVIFYYFALISNLILRYIWLINMFIPSNPNYDEMKILVFGILEMYRRIQTVLLRTENENQNNFEKYRTFLEIPDLPVD